MEEMCIKCKRYKCICSDHSRTIYKINKDIVYALKRACPAYEPAPCDCNENGCDCGNVDDAQQMARWQERMSIADHIGKIIEEYLKEKEVE